MNSEYYFDPEHWIDTSEPDEAETTEDNDYDF